MPGPSSRQAAEGIVEVPRPEEFPHAPGGGVPGIAIVAYGSWGDFLPLCELGARLAQDGFPVVLMTYRSRQALVEQRGIQFVEFPERLLHRRGPPPGWIPARLTGSRYTQDLLFLWRKRQVTEQQTLYTVACLEALLEAGWGHVLSPDWCVGAREFAERHPGRVTHVLLTPGSIHSEYAGSGIPEPPLRGWPRRLYRRAYWLASDLAHLASLGAGQNRGRLRLGLPVRLRLRKGWQVHYGTTLALFSEGFAPPQPDWPGVFCAGFVTPRAVEEHLPEDIVRFLDRAPTLLFTCGSMCHRTPRFFAVARAYALATGSQALLLGSDPRGETLDCDRVRWSPFLPLASVLPRCAAIVHHGGIGTTLQAILAQTPQVVVPVALDQWDQACRVRELGAGIDLAPSAFNVLHVTRAIAEVLQDGYRVRIAELAARERANDTLANAVEFVRNRLRAARHS